MIFQEPMTSLNPVLTVGRQITEAIEGGEVRMLYLLTDFEGLEPGAWVEDAKTGVTKGLAQHKAWKRSAVTLESLRLAWTVSRPVSCSL